MRIGDVVKTLLGSTALYLVMAACSAEPAGSGASPNGQLAGASTDGGGTAPGDQVGGEQDSSTADGRSLLDALTDPVPSANADTGNTSGTRLKARNYVGADGARQFVGWRDSQLGVDCAFGAGEDGKIRCLPTAAIIDPSYFSNITCTQRITYPGPCGAPKYAAEGVAGACGGALRIYAVGAKATGTKYISVPDVGGGPNKCMAAGAITTDVYAVAAAIPAAAFVEATEQVDP